MRKLICLAGLLLLGGSLAAAQEAAPIAEVYGGYSYVRINPGSGANGINAHGGSGNIAYNFTPELGVVGDFGYYRAGDLGLGIVIPGTSISGHLVSYTFGPRYTLRSGTFEPFVQGLFGGARMTASATVAGVTTSISDNAFAMALGGGMNWKASPRLAVRLFQAEYVLTRFGFLGANTNQHNARISGGIVFRFGEL